MSIQKCYNCSFSFYNGKSYKIATRKGMTQPHTRYCQHPDIKMQKLGKRALDSYGYPVWCRLLEGSCTCLYCGCTIRAEEGDTCKKHRHNK